MRGVPPFYFIGIARPPGRGVQKRKKPRCISGKEKGKHVNISWG